jgi:hypothetical protein
MDQPALLKMKASAGIFRRQSSGQCIPEGPAGTGARLMGENGAAYSTLMKCLFGI